MMICRILLIFAFVFALIFMGPMHGFAQTPVTPPGTMLSPLTGTPLPKTSQWLLYQGGLQAWIDRAGAAGLIDTQDHAALEQMAALIQRKGSGTDGDTAQFGVLQSAFNSQNPSSIMQRADYQSLPPEWKRALAPLMQFIQIEEALMPKSAASSMPDMIDATSAPIDFDVLLQQYIAQIIKQTIGDPAKAVSKVAVKIDTVTAGENGRGWITALRFRFNQWLQSWLVFLMPQHAIISKASLPATQNPAAIVAGPSATKN